VKDTPAEAPAAPDFIDPLAVIREECREHHCSKYVTRYEECNTRVQGKSKTSETCVEELIDLMHCQDHCAIPKLFKKLA